MGEHENCLKIEGENDNELTGNIEATISVDRGTAEFRTWYVR